MKNGSGRAVALLALIISVSTMGSAAAGWAQNDSLEQPDLILRPAAPVAVPAGSSNKIQQFRLGSDQPKDRWIRAFDFEPGDPRVVRSAFFYIEKTGQWLGAWSQGLKTVEFPETVAAYLPAGSSIIVDINYQSGDSDAEDLSSLGLYFTDRKPLRPLTAVGVVSRVDVPASGEVFKVEKDFTIISDSYALGLRPEMKAFGQSFEVNAVDPAGSSQVLLVVKDYKPEAQDAYAFQEPLFIGKGTRIVVTGFYRNDSALTGDDLFKVSMALYPSDEYRPTSYDAPQREFTPTKAKSAKKTATTRKSTPAKKPAKPKRNGR